jgi:holliday junction DNA helicase RuvA
MISLIEGKVFSNNGIEAVILTTGGVGYAIKITPGLAKRLDKGTNAVVSVYLAVREDAMDLYGFADDEEKRLFKQLISVSGIGPKSAMHLLSLGEAKELSAAITRGDLTHLTKVSGIGRKTAERIIVELKNKMVELDLSGGGESGKIGEVIDGLISLGYSGSDAREAVKDLSVDLPAEQIIKEALKRLSK